MAREEPTRDAAEAQQSDYRGMGRSSPLPRDAYRPEDDEVTRTVKQVPGVNVESRSGSKVTLGFNGHKRSGHADALIAVKQQLASAGLDDQYQVEKGDHGKIIVKPT